MTQPKRTLPRVLGEIVFLVAMFGTIAGGVPIGLALLLPAGFCMSMPISEMALVMSLAVWVGIAFPKGKEGLGPLLRLGAVMLVGTVIAFFAARLAVGCTFVTGWDEHAHKAIANVTVLVIVTPLAYLHRHYIEPRWARAMG